jgi:threonine synthase
MGAPIHQLIVGSNSNDILTRFFETQEMRAQSVLPTLSPSMDIQVSSNFERLLFEMNNRDGTHTASQLGRFRSEGGFAVSPEQYNTWLAPVFRAARCDDATTLEVIRDVFEKTGQLIDPHTAVGVFGARQHQGADVPMVTLATAHAAKFTDAVQATLPELSVAIDAVVAVASAEVVVKAVVAVVATVVKAVVTVVKVVVVVIVLPALPQLLLNDQ